MRVTNIVKTLLSCACRNTSMKIIITSILLMISVSSFAAFSSDGGTRYIKTGTASTFKFLHGGEDQSNFKWSISLWCKRNIATGIKMIAGTSNEGGGTDTGLFLYINAGGDIDGNITNGTASIQLEFLAAGGPDDLTQFHHYVITYDRSLGSANSKVYYDGVFGGSKDKTGAASASDANQPLHIGIYANETAAGRLDGQLDDYRIYKNKVLTQSEITEIYNARGRDKIIDNLVLRYQFNDAITGAAFGTIFDSANGNTGTTVGSPTASASVLTLK